MPLRQQADYVRTELIDRLPNIRVIVAPNAHNHEHYDIVIGDGPGAMVTTFDDNVRVTLVDLDGWADRYRSFHAPMMNIPYTYTGTWDTVTTAGMMAQVERVDDIIQPDNLILNQAHDALLQVMAANERTTGGTRTMAPDAVTATIGQTVTNMRSAEQEVRYRDYHRRITVEGGRALSPGERDDYQHLVTLMPWIFNGAPGTPAPVAPPAPTGPRIRVRVWRDDYQTWNITCRVDNNAIELPPIAVIKALLPPGDKRHLPSRQSRYRNTTGMLKTALAAGLPAQSLHDALRAWLIASRAGITNAESDANMLADDLSPLLIAQPATLEVGGKVYRLVPTNEMDTRPFIRRVRARALTVAKVQGDAILAKSRTDAQVVVREAERRAANLRAKLEAERARAGSRVPEWVVRSMRPHYFYDGYWRVEIKVACKVREIRLTVAPWATVLYWNPIRIPNKDDSYYNNRKMPLWVRLSDEGHYDKNNIYAKEWACTHIESYMCMELQGLPPALTSNTHLQELENVISRGMMVVNLNSPLCTTPDRYWPDFREQIHPTPLRMMATMGRSDQYIVPNGLSMERYKEANPELAWDRFETIQQETDGIFRVPDPLSPGTPTHRAVRWAVR